MIMVLLATPMRPPTPATLAPVFVRLRLVRLIELMSAPSVTPNKPTLLLAALIYKPLITAVGCKPSVSSLIMPVNGLVLLPIGLKPAPPFQF